MAKSVKNDTEQAVLDKNTIVTSARIKDLKILPEKVQVNFDGCTYTTDQCKKLARLVQDQESIELVIRPVQGNLFPEAEQ